MEQDGSGHLSDRQEEFAREVRIEDMRGADAWVSVIGTVISRSAGDSCFVIDDGTGQVTVRAHMMPELGTLVRVVGRVLMADRGTMVEGEIVQDFSSFDVELYRKVGELEGKVFSQDEDCHR